MDARARPHEDELAGNLVLRALDEREDLDLVDERAERTERQARAEGIDAGVVGRDPFGAVDPDIDAVDPERDLLGRRAALPRDQDVVPSPRHDRAAARRPGPRPELDLEAEVRRHLHGEPFARGAQRPRAAPRGRAERAQPRAHRGAVRADERARVLEEDVAPGEVRAVPEAPPLRRRAAQRRAARLPVEREQRRGNEAVGRERAPVRVHVDHAPDRAAHGEVARLPEPEPHLGEAGLRGRAPLPRLQAGEREAEQR